MPLYLLFAFGPPVIGILLGVLWWFLRTRRDGALSPGIRALSIIAVGVGFAVLLVPHVDAALWLWGAPAELTMRLLDLRYTLPLIVGIPVVAVLAIPGRTRRLPGVAQVARRTLLSFLPIGWVIAVAVIVLFILALTLSAGFASVPDDFGDHRMFEIEIGSLMTAGTEIYGWYYSVVPLALIGVLLIVAAFAIGLIARPPLSFDPDEDARVRRVRSTNVARVTAGALMLHCAAVLSSLSGTAALYGTTTAAGSAGAISVGTSFAALEGALRVSGQVAVAAGLFLWIVALMVSLAKPRSATSKATP
ncbi:uncharacterized membrane protein YidH (DUF202 family) [Microbacterium sp. ZKA21]|uniref:hypothetical protein n=1 Tax=Microbacterium sp. ZKA21 TaxID=3381694 RepID=UPI003D1F0880